MYIYIYKYIYALNDTGISEKFIDIFTRTYIYLLVYVFTSLCSHIYLCKCVYKYIYT